MPRTGGQYAFLIEAYGPLWAFVSAWKFMLAVMAGGSTWLAVTFSIYGVFRASHCGHVKSFAVALIAAVSAVNYTGVREGAWVQRIFTWLKIVGCWC